MLVKRLLVLGFEFNIRGKLGTTLFAQFTTSIDRVAGTLDVSIPSFIPLNMIAAPIVSFLFGLICLFFWVQKRAFQIPNWQIILNLCMLFFQLIFIIV